MRVDKLLWFLRLAKTRPWAQSIVESGHMRINGRRIERSHQKVIVGDVLTIPTQDGVRVIEIITLPERRGPVAEALSCYRILDAAPLVPIAAPSRNEAC